MIRNYILVAAGCLLLPSIAPAIGIGVIGGDPVAPLLDITGDLVDVQPTAANCISLTGDCTFVFNNDTGAIITSLDFNMDIATGLTKADIAESFSCSQGGLGYFKNCAVTYNAITGDLDYLFSGVNQPEGDEQCPQKDCEVNEREGIPPAAPGYRQFSITLTGWVADATVGDPMPLFPNGLPTFTNSFTTPEPSSLIALGIGSLLLVGVVQFRRRKALSRS